MGDGALSSSWRVLISGRAGPCFRTCSRAWDRNLAVQRNGLERLHSMCSRSDIRAGISTYIHQKEKAYTTRWD